MNPRKDVWKSLLEKIPVPLSATTVSWVLDGKYNMPDRDKVSTPVWYVLILMMPTG